MARFIDPGKEDFSIEAIEAEQAQEAAQKEKDRQLKRAGTPTFETVAGPQGKQFNTGRVGIAGVITKSRGPAGPIGKGSAKEGQKLLSRFAKMAELSGKGGGNIKGLQELQAAGIGTAVVSQTFRDPNSLATMAIRKGLLQGPGGASREIAKTRFNGLEISVFTDQKTARLARMIGATLKSRAKQRRRPRR